MIQRGYIYESTDKEKDPHFFICMDDEVEGKDMYRACILTHASHADNCEHVPMAYNHFYNKRFCRVRYDSIRGTYLVVVGFEKKIVNIVPQPVGQLRPEGLAFVEDQMQGHEYAYFPKPMSEYP